LEGAVRKHDETDLMREIKHRLNETGRCRLLRNTVGVDVSRGVKYGYVGSPDLWGVLPSGVCFAIEVKTPTGRIRPEQSAWFKAAYKWGVRGGVARSLDGAFRLLDEAEAGPMTGDLRDYE
jgi:hypothetical protein